ncbi:MAG: recombinase family protein [Clostridia bacterium]|nr:recombinase family protein [Clostridia bacterium]
MIYGYARVSTKGQARDGNSLEEQREKLTLAGADVVYYEAFTGTKKDRPELDKLLKEIKPGDTLVVTKLDRLARSIKFGAEIIENLAERGITVNILNLGVMNNTPNGKLMRNIFLSFAEFERDMIVERTQEGKRIARQRPDFKDGRPRKENIRLEYYLDMYRRGEITGKQAAKELNLSPATFSRRANA